MIAKGTIVRRLSDDFLSHISRHVLKNRYPPEQSICIVVSNPSEKDLSNQMRVVMDGYVSLKKAVDVLYEGSLYKNCEVRAFSEVKKSDRENL